MCGMMDAMDMEKGEMFTMDYDERVSSKGRKIRGFNHQENI